MSRWIFVKASAVPWTPASLSSTYGWWDASDPNTVYDAVSGGNLVTANNAEVLRLEDKSPNGWHVTRNYTNNLTNGRPALKTAFTNGLNAIRTFDEDSADTSVQLNSSYHNAFVRNDVPVGKGVPALSGISVQQRVSTVGLGCAFKVFGSSSNTVRLMDQRDNSPGRIRATAADGTVIAVTPYTNASDVGTNWTTTCVTGNYNKTTGSVVVHMNGVQRVVADAAFSGVSDNNNAFRIFVAGSTFGTQDVLWGNVGYFGELIIVEDSLSDNTDLRHKLEGYLHHKWGIASVLPLDHPYKDSPPTI